MYFITLLFLILLIFLIKRDNRSVLNPILLVIFLIMGYLSFAKFSYDKGFELINNLLFGLGFIILPLCIFISGLFLIYNGIILLRKEGRSKANFLSLLMGLSIICFFFLIFIQTKFSYNKFFIFYDFY